QMIWIANNITSTFNAYNYWSATQYGTFNSNGSWYVSFTNGHTHYFDRTARAFRVRCVREIP
ncbi:MAG: hypothetical protein RSC34_05070, partial [Alistipes sp.]